MITNSEVKSVEGEPGNFSVTLTNHPRYIDLEKCTGCGDCARHCPVAAVNEVNKGLDDRRATYIEYAQAVPLAYAIDTDVCIGCGLCVRVCPAGTLAMVGDKARVVGDQSLNCGHCAAACPVDAVRVGSLSAETIRFSSFSSDSRWLPPGQFDLAQLVRLMGSRRSCRNFKDKPVPLERLEDLVKIGISAPSGTNCQPWTFTLLPNRAAVMELMNAVAAFFARLNRQAARPWLRALMRLTGENFGYDKSAWMEWLHSHGKAEGGRSGSDVDWSE